MVEGREEAALSHIMTVNGWSRHQAREAADAALAQWHDRTRYSWQSDYSLVTRRHGFEIDDAGIVRAEQANVEVVAITRHRATGLSSTQEDAVKVDVLTQSHKDAAGTITSFQPDTNRSIIDSILKAARSMICRL